MLEFYLLGCHEPSEIFWLNAVSGFVWPILFFSFGQVEKARSHLLFSGQPDQFELQKLKLLEKILNQCADARKAGDWKSALKESEAAMAAGADFSPQVELIDMFVYVFFVYSDLLKLM